MLVSYDDTASGRQYGLDRHCGVWAANFGQVPFNFQAYGRMGAVFGRVLFGHIANEPSQPRRILPRALLLDVGNPIYYAGTAFNRTDVAYRQIVFYHRPLRSVAITIIKISKQNDNRLEAEASRRLPI